MGEMRNAYKILVGKSEGMRPREKRKGMSAKIVLWCYGILCWKGWCPKTSVAAV